MKTVLSASPLNCAIFVLLAFLAGCGTPYKPSAYTGAPLHGSSGLGYKDKRLGAGLYRVAYIGNGFTVPRDSMRMAMKRAAELCLQDDYTHFVVLSISRAAMTDPAFVHEFKNIGTEVVGVKIDARTPLSSDPRDLVANHSVSNSALGGEEGVSPTVGLLVKGLHTPPSGQVKYYISKDVFANP